MADIIDKTGKYFAEQEQQLRQVYVQTAAHTALPPTTYLRTPVQPPPRRQQQELQSVEPDALPGRHPIKEQQQPSLLRRRLSLQSSCSTSASAFDTPATVPTVVPPLALSPPTPPQAFPKRGDDASSWSAEDAWSDANDDGFASRRSAQSSYDAKLPARTAQPIDRSVGHPEVESSDDDKEGGGSQSSGCNSKSSSSSTAKPRKTPLKRRGSLKKKRRSSSSKQILSELDPEQSKREKEQRIAAALVLAQERAKRIQAEREQQMRERELVNHEEQCRVQEEMEKIEAIRLKSKQFALRLRPRIGTNVSSNNDNSCPDAKDANEPPIVATEDPESSPTFLDVMERQLRDRMVIELRVREKSLASQQAQDQEWARVCSQLEKQDARNEKQQQRITQLEAAKQLLERELLKVQEQLQASRSQRLELEETSRRERVQRQRDAERQLRARVRTEEWNRMLDDERARSEVAAEARERAGQRVVSRASSLKKKALELKEESLRRRRNGRSSDNNETGEDDEFELLRARLSDGKPKFGLLFAPELAEFEEDGLLSDEAISAKPVSPTEFGYQASATMVTAVDPREETKEVADTTEEDEPSAPETDPSSLDTVHATEPSGEVPKFQWRVPAFEDRTLFDRLLLHEMLTSVSDSE